MFIFTKEQLPIKIQDKEYSLRVFFYQTNHKKFGLCYYDFHNNIWVDNDGIILTEDFVWVSLPIKTMKAFIKMKEEANQENNEH